MAAARSTSVSPTRAGPEVGLKSVDARHRTSIPSSSRPSASPPSTPLILPPPAPLPFSTPMKPREPAMKTQDQTR
ncbi:hypothetical protein SISSUDRAFT_437083 [Sistotremastrum suecicum HHB10207 ss-3]|uniref:Uncharacterized protein n=1 Tax=Sistotremastrum suecicum HHB10207 ss-3 TaxID=1314776 RepID=A0A166FIT2_9AGAM|nr:hypothetical protein SISSUDRAFT_437083 [Sistotremastrum suecicum HHB10207 ss-3]